MGNRILATLVALLGTAALSSAALAQSCSLPSLTDSVDLKPLPGSSLMTVPVAVNGTPKQFLLDVGTNPTEISQAAVTQLGLPEAVKRTENISADSGNMVARGGNLSSLTNGGLGNVSVRDVRDKLGLGNQTPVRITSFTLGNATGQHLMFLVANDADMGKAEPYDGLMTGDFFKQYDVEMDFGNKELNYLTPTRCTDPDKVVFWAHSNVAVIPITMTDGGKISVPVSVQGHQINAVIDTSSSRTMMRRDVAELIVGLKADTPDMPASGDLKDGKGQQVYAHTFSQISFAGGVTAINVPALILTNNLTHQINNGVELGSWARSQDAKLPDLTLGMDVLHQLHLYVVYGQKNLYVTSATLN